MDPERDAAATEDVRIDFDEPLPGVSAMLAAFARELDGRMEHGDAVSWSIESIHVDLPLELEIDEDEDRMSVGATPPLVDFETSVTPIFHRAFVTFVRSDG